MAETNGDTGKPSLKPEDLSRAIFSSSTKLRISTLETLTQRVRDDGTMNFKLVPLNLC
jgi:hypothetical protein